MSMSMSFGKNAGGGSRFRDDGADNVGYEDDYEDDDDQFFEKAPAKSTRNYSGK